MEIDSNIDSGMLQRISKGVKSRKRREPLRITYDASMPDDLRKRVLNKLELDRYDTVVSGGKYHNHKDLIKFPDFGRSDLKYPKWQPIRKPELAEQESILEAIRQKDRFIHVPYHDFSSFLRVLQEAAVSKNVKSVKITLYRLAKDSKVVKALIGAARNGKKVTVVIELLARFDEASNIHWSKKMRDAGINIEIIGGQEEAQMIYNNHVEQMEDRKGNYMYVDVGGGSTEINMLSDGELVFSHSYNIGTIRILNQAVKESEWNALKTDVTRIAEQYPETNIIGSGGNINKYYKMVDEKDSARQRMPVESLKKLYLQLKDMSMEERMRTFKLKTDRADVIVPAGEIFTTIADILKSSFILVPVIGLSDGIIDGIYAKHKHQQL